MNQKSITPTFGTGIYLPEQILDNAELEKRNIILISGKQLRAVQILEKIGVERRHISAENETVADMGFKAASKALKDNKIIDLLLVSSSHPTPFNVAAEIKKLLQLEQADIMDIHSACSGSAMMFSYIFNKQKELQGKNVLFVATEKFSNSVVDLTRPDAMQLDSSLGQTIFGDGAAAINFTVGKDIIVHSVLNKALPDADGKTDLILMAMGENKFVEPCLIKPVSASPKPKDFPQGYFAQNGPRVFENVLNNIPTVIREAVSKAGFTAKDIDLVIVHSGSKRVVTSLRDRLAPDFEVYSDYADANMSSVSLLYSFIKAVQDKRIGRGSKVVLSGFGAGSPDLYSSTAVIELK